MKIAEFAIIPSKHPHETARAFYMSWVCRYGVPSCVTTDNGSEFQTDFSVMLHRLNVKHVVTSTEHPVANGAVERLVQSMKTMLASHVNGRIRYMALPAGPTAISDYLRLQALEASFHQPASTQPASLCQKGLSDSFCRLPIQHCPGGISSLQLPACCCTSLLAAFAWCADFFVMLTCCRLMPLAAFRRVGSIACCICAPYRLPFALLWLDAAVCAVSSLCAGACFGVCCIIKWR